MNKIFHYCPGSFFNPVHLVNPVQKILRKIHIHPNSQRLIFLLLLRGGFVIIAARVFARPFRRKKHGEEK